MLLQRLAEACGMRAVDADPGSRSLAAHDIFLQAEDWPVCVLRPADSAALARGLHLLATEGVAVAPRGGGMSYTGGYLPQGRWVCVDLAGLNRVRELNVPDLYITLEAGCTWAQVRQALAGTGTTTPYGGPLSGLRATVGGALSQNSVFFGAGQHGSAAESVLGLEVMLADGQCLRTGSAASAGASAFSRWGGPDLTGLFLGDCGALGIKTAATLRLVPAPAAQGHASYGFPDLSAMVAAQVALMRAGLGSEAFGIDAYKARHSAQTGHKLAEGLRTLTHLARSGPTLAAGILAAAEVARAGTNFLEVHPYSLHLSLDGDSPAHVSDRLARVAAICVAQQGQELPGSVPQVLRAQPFQPLRSVLAHNGDRWVPVHGIVPLSRAQTTVQAVERLIAQRGAEMAAHGIVYSPLTANTDRAFLFEPCFYWPDEIYPLHTDVLGEALTAPWRSRPAAPAARALVAQLWQDTACCMQEHGAVHLQIGRAYPYLQRLEPATRALLQSIKQFLDPQSRMNPGSLGLGMSG